MTTTTVLRAVRRAWSLDLGWWTVPLAAVIATPLAAVATHTMLHPFRGGSGSYVAVNVDWGRSFEIGLLAGAFAALAATYTELRGRAVRRTRARQAERASASVR
jgi:hypothetical protein